MVPFHTAVFMVKENKSPHRLPLANVLLHTSVPLSPNSVGHTYFFYAWYFSMIILKSLYDHKHDRQKLYLI